jgi:hypothetical protein
MCRLQIRYLLIVSYVKATVPVSAHPKARRPGASTTFDVAGSADFAAPLFLLPLNA